MAKPSAHLEALDDMDERELQMVAIVHLAEINRSTRFIATVVAVLVALWVLGLVLAFVGVATS